MKKISRYILYKEAICGCGQCNRLELKPPIVYLFDETRERFGQPLIITSAFRCRKFQSELRKKGYKAAKLSAHNYGWALDIKILKSTTAESLIELFTTTARQLQMEQPRFGYKKYRSHIHVDLVFYGYEPYTNIPNPRKDAWQPGIIW